MVKLRMNTADVAAEVKCLRSLIGMRCSNVYDLSPKTYVFKLIKSSGVTESGESEKVLLLVESGTRLHTTAFARDKSLTPSGFTLKLRKHIRTRRLEDVRQFGMDRVVDFQFGMGEGAYHIILELYAQGNLLLTDGSYNVLTLLRTHRDVEKGLTMMAHHQYPVDSCRSWERTSSKKLETLLTVVTDEDTSTSETLDNLAVKTSPENEAGEQGAVKGKKSGKKSDTANDKDKNTLKSIVGEGLGYGPVLSEHIVLAAGLPKNLKVFSKNEGGHLVAIIDKKTVDTLYSAIVQFEDWLESIIFGDQIPEGYILLQGKKDGKGSALQSEQQQSKLYEEFSPLRLNQCINGEFLNFTTFDGAMDEFFSKVEGQRAEQQRKAQEDSAFQKLDKIRKDQENRVEALKKEVDHSVTLAELIEYNLEDVDAAIVAVRSALATGMNWNDLIRMIKEERKAGNPIASIIHSLQLEKDQITLLLCNNLDDMDEEEKTRPATKVEVDLSLSAHANARRWFELKKKQLAKQEKTVAAHEKAFKAAERKTQQQLAQEKVVAAISHIRKVHWFEKFNWFISSENYLIISGRDAQQNELLVKRYMKKGDLYVHADLHGASSTVIKNHNPNGVVPPLTLNQAGCFTVCCSQAWDSKIVTSAWWVYAHQVSKTAPTGEYLTVGSFMIRGKKNFLPPHPLVMGFGILFRLEESCVAAHLNDRKALQEGEDENEQEQDLPLEDIPSEGEDIGEVSRPVEIDLELSATKNTLTCNHPENGQVADVSEVGLAKSGEDASLSTDPANLGELLDKAFELSTRLHLGKPAKKYGLDSYPNHDSTEITKVNDENTVDSISGKGTQRQRPYLSKAERRKAKKVPLDDGVPGTGAKVMTDMLKEKGTSDDLESDKEESKGSRDAPPLEKASRGRNAKLKKIKEKYAEQDDEERELRMALLASSGKQAVKANDKKTQKKTEEAKSEAIEVTDRIKICYKCKRSGHVAKDCSSFTPNSDYPEAQQPIDLISELSANNDKYDDEGILDLADDEKEKLSELDLLTAKPYTDDILLYAVPVCGPYSALQGYKYRVKLTPGNAKRGKAAKTAMNVFMHMPETTPREKELMKAMNDPELVAAIIGNTKVTAPGLTQLKHRQKKGKKSSKDED